MSDGSSGAASGIVLAGGQSRRMGRDKVLESFDGQPLLRRALDRVSGVTGENIVWCCQRVPVTVQG